MLNLFKNLNRPAGPLTTPAIVSYEGRFEFFDLKPKQESLRSEVFKGLTAKTKTLDPKLFYDVKGSQLFEMICETEEYYLTRTETAILERFASEIRHAIGDDCLLIEFGSGNSKKIRLLLEELEPAAYMAIDISREALLQGCSELAELYINLNVIGVCADYGQPFDLPTLEHIEHERKLCFFPGSTIGNMTPKNAQHFLHNIRDAVGPGGGLLIGVDLKKKESILNAAYNDRAGITAAFNLNVLERVNREMNADFDLCDFEHYAFYNDAHGRVEMHLVSKRTQRIHVDGQAFEFAPGESIHTENSYKYTVPEFQSLAMGAGFTPQRVWTDADGLFSVQYLVAD